MPWPSDREPDDGLTKYHPPREGGAAELDPPNSIASENFTSPAVSGHGIGSHEQVLRGLPGQALLRRHRYIDEAEDARPRASEGLFGGEHANVQPHAEPMPTWASTSALLHPGDTVLGMSPRPRRPPHPRLAGQHQRPLLRLRAYRRQPKTTSGSTSTRSASGWRTGRR